MSLNGKLPIDRLRARRKRTAAAAASSSREGDKNEEVPASASAEGSASAPDSDRHPLPAEAIFFAGFPLSTAGLPLPADLDRDESRRRSDAVRAELRRHRENPPALPETRIGLLPEKPLVDEFFEIPDDVTGELRTAMEQHNSKVGEKLLQLDRERNNQAALKSRRHRNESLADATAMLYDKSVENIWLRVRLACAGVDVVAEWDAVPSIVKMAMRNQMTEAVKKITDKRDDDKRNLMARKRRERNTIKDARRRQIATAAAQASAESNRLLPGRPGPKPQLKLPPLSSLQSKFAYNVTIYGESNSEDNGEGPSTTQQQGKTKAETSQDGTDVDADGDYDIYSADP